MSTALYPGSFDPITLGHINIIERALDIFDRLIVVIAVNPQKTPLFTVEENLAMIREATRQWPQVEADHTEGLLVDYARARGIRKAVRGLRAVTDFEAEFAMALTNRRLWPDFDTVYLMTAPEYLFLRSSTVREVSSMGGDVTGMVPDGVERRLRARFGKP
ncbi:MAG: pantetheine-phosphate adenylyltransferase [Gemmatimonadota bacterium]